MVMLDIATRFEPVAPVRGRALAVAGLLPALAAAALALLPRFERSALALGGIALLVSGVALVRALGGRRRGRNLAVAGVVLGLLAGIGVLVSQATYAPGLPARPEASVADRPSAVAPTLTDVTVTLGRYGKAGVPVTVRNTSLRQRSVDLTVAAVTRKGRRIATDTISASRLAPGSTNTVTAFEGASADLAGQLRSARFLLIDTASYS